MGIMTRPQGEQFIITSDRNLNDAPINRAPKKSSDFSWVWTGSEWSTTLADAKRFPSLDQADEYTKANYARISGPRPA